MKSREIDDAHGKAVSDGAQRLRRLHALAAEAERRLRARREAPTAQDGCIGAAAAPELAIGAAGAPRADPLGADATAAALPGTGRVKDAGLAGGWLLESGAAMLDDTIAGSSDRAHQHALKLGRATPPLRQAVPGRTPALPPLRPSSRADCQRRCGTAGFCDPASAFGCGGEFCANRYEPL
jgi:hypothetical protein